MLNRDKTEIARQWDTDPCGAETAASERPESRAWYESVRMHRYVEYAPWIPQAFRFERWRGRKALEIGVGLGSDHYSLAMNAVDLTALDLSREHLRHATKHLRLFGYNTSGTLGDAERMPFATGSFDLVYSFGALHHTTNTEVAINEIERVLRPGGTALIALYHRDSFFFWFWTFCVGGLLKLGFLRKGWRQVLSEIERRSSGNTAVPLVKVYSRRQARKLFRNFDGVRVATHHVESSAIPGVGTWLEHRFGRAWLEEKFGFLGWYIVVEATKRAR